MSYSTDIKQLAANILKLPTYISQGDIDKTNAKLEGDQLIAPSIAFTLSNHLKAVSKGMLFPSDGKFYPDVNGPEAQAYNKIPAAGQLRDTLVKIANDVPLEAVDKLSLERAALALEEVAKIEDKIATNEESLIDPHLKSEHLAGQNWNALLQEEKWDLFRRSVPLHDQSNLRHLDPDDPDFMDKYNKEKRDNIVHARTTGLRIRSCKADCKLLAEKLGLNFQQTPQIE